MYCTLSMYVTSKTISHQNQKTNTTPQLYCTLSTKVCKTKTYFLSENWHNRTTVLYATKYVRNTKNYFPPEPKKLTEHHNFMVL